jgi:mannose-6-phosphate isomerase
VKTDPIVLRPNPVERFYAGGPRIAAFRGLDSWSETAPEDWVGSVTAVAGERQRGRSVLPSGALLADELAADPEAFFGPSHAARSGSDPGMLVKLLDAGERLPVHWHPDRGFATMRLHSCYGKTEAWFIVEAEPGAVVHLGWRRDVADGDLRAWLASQDVDGMLATMHRVPVRRGDTVFVPAGCAHSIGQGILLVEMQEPTDLSVLLEWKGFCDDPTGIGDLGLGYEAALTSVTLPSVTPDALERLRGSRPRHGRGAGIRPIFPPEADPFFRAELVGAGARLEPTFAILVFLEGDGSLTWAGGAMRVRRGDTVLVPYAAGEVVIAGRVSAVRCLPPLDVPRATAGGGPPTTDRRSGEVIHG